MNHFPCKRPLSILLVLVMLLTLLPAVPSAAAAEAEEVQSSAAISEEMTLDESAVPAAVGVEEARARHHVQRMHEDEGDDLNKIISATPTAPAPCTCLTTLSNT